MRLLASLGLTIALLSVPAGALAQGGSPFAPLPPAPPPTPAPPKPPSNPDAAQEDDGELSTVELLGLAGIAVLLFGAVALVIFREGRRLNRRDRKGKGRSRRKTSAPMKANAPRSGDASRSVRGDGRKAPPPPPRKKRRQKSKRG